MASCDTADWQFALRTPLLLAAEDESAHNSLSTNDGHQGVCAVVAGHHETTGADFAWRNGPVFIEFDIWLSKRAAVNVKSAVAEGDFLAWKPDNAFDHQLFSGPNGDDVTPLGWSEKIGQLVD